MSLGTRLDSREGIFDDNRPFWINPEQLSCDQKRIRGGLSGQMLRLDHLAVDLHIESCIQLGGPQDRCAVLT
jgi:hypothetical protein